MAACKKENATPYRPIILITPDIEASIDTPTEATYRVRTNYAEAVEEAGGLPLILPYEAKAFTSLLTLANGVLITGSNPGVEVEPQRRTYEMALIEHTIRAKKPLLGICYGMQLIGEWLGGTCSKSLPCEAHETVGHLPKTVPDVLAHPIRVEPNSLLGSILNGTETKVNSLHRHALRDGGRFRVIARSLDGVIEAFEGDTPSFCLGLQWHPEYRLSNFDREIFRMFIRESAKLSAKIE